MWGLIAVGLFADPTLKAAAYGGESGGLFYGHGKVRPSAPVGVQLLPALKAFLTSPMLPRFARSSFLAPSVA